MTEAAKDYITVNEKGFWKEKSLDFNPHILDQNLQGIVQAKLTDLNAKLSDKYDVGMTDFSGSEKLSDAEIKVITAQLQEVAKWFNTLIDQLAENYIWKTEESKQEIQAEITGFFSDKSLFVNEWTGMVAALSGYATGNPEQVVSSKRGKELPLN